ncbi:DUF6282 family protein [Chloroflexota bacterium]
MSAVYGAMEVCHMEHMNELPPLVAVNPSRPRKDELLLQGAIDTHAHALPHLDEDMYMLDIFQLARSGAEVGMRAMVVKNHMGSSCGEVYLANKYSGGCHLIGGVCLNRSVGGINPQAVTTAAQFGSLNGVPSGRVVWMPERDSLHNAKLFNVPQDKLHWFLTPFAESRIENGLTPAAREVCKRIAAEDMVLATGHLSAAESIALIKEAKDLGVKRFIVTHVSGSEIDFTLETKKQAVELGAMLEESVVVWMPVMRHLGFRIGDAYEDVIADMKVIGAEHYCLSSDFGITECPPPVEGMREFIRLCLDVGFNDDEIRAMAGGNAARLLGL